MVSASMRYRVTNMGGYEMARAFVVTLTKINGNQRLLGTFTQAKKVHEALVEHGHLPTSTVICAHGYDPLPFSYSALNNRLRQRGKVELWSNCHHGFVQRCELNEVIK